MSSPDRRVVALDWMRGLVMVLMTVDHASGVFNRGRLMADSVAMYQAGTPLPAAQFFTRWVTHLCAPTFVFLAGAALALSAARRTTADDGFLLRRGLFIAALDPLWMSWVFVPGRILLQVLWAIGGSFVAMTGLRRLPERALLAAGLVVLVVGDLLAAAALWVGGGQPGLPAALLLTGGQFGSWIVAYPLVPWLAIMLLGWCLGRRLARDGAERTARLLVGWGAAALVAFVVVRGANGLGNLGLLREDASLVQWLHVSKYPPSLSYAALELGLMALLLAGAFRLERAGWALGPLRVLGQTALFYYLWHVHLLTLAGWATGWAHRGGVASAWGAAAACLLLLYPLCVRYGRYKRAHPDGWTRYV